MSDFKMPTAYEDVPCEWTAGVVQRDDDATEERHGVAAVDVLRSIDQLRRDLSGYHGQLKAHDDLQRHCDNQRKRIGELEALYADARAERDETAMAFSKEHDRAEFLMRENAKMRELLAETFMPYRDYAKKYGIAPYFADVNEHLDARLRELGIEAEQ